MAIKPLQESHPPPPPGTIDEDDAGSEGSEDQGVELLEYEWPDLPPLPTIKDAVTRNRVRSGISYVLPVDRGLNAVNKFRTDLRAMFLEPYSSDDLHFDENKIKASCKVHFRRNTCDTKWTHQHVSSVPTSLNAESEHMRQLYARSAPSGGGAARRLGLGIDSNKLRTRSSLYLPLKASVSPEMVKIRREVEQMVKSVTGDDDDDFDDNRVMVQDKAAEFKDRAVQEKVGESKTKVVLQGKSAESRQSEGEKVGQRKWSSTAVPTGGTEKNAIGRKNNNAAGISRPQSNKTPVHRVRPFSSTSERFETYDDLRKSTGSKREIPADLKSQYLSDQQNQSIWDWLHHGQNMSDFDYFLSVCG